MIFSFILADGFEMLQHRLETDESDVNLMKIKSEAGRFCHFVGKASVRWCSGYHVCFTRRRSRVQTSLEPFVFIFPSFPFSCQKKRKKKDRSKNFSSTHNCSSSTRLQRGQIGTKSRAKCRYQIPTEPSINHH